MMNDPLISVKGLSVDYISEGADINEFKTFHLIYIQAKYLDSLVNLVVARAL